MLGKTSLKMPLDIGVRVAGGVNAYSVISFTSFKAP